MEIRNKLEVVLNCRGNGTCCPVVTKIDNDEYHITDDFNGKVKLTKEHLRQLKDAVGYFEKLD